MNMPPPRRIKVSDVALNVYDAGEGPAVVLCHGFPELARSWNYQFAALVDAGFRVIAADQRGYGLSDAPREIVAYDLGKLTGDMAGLLDALGIEKAVFAGHDWGGFVAWAMPVLHPERVLGVIGVNTPNATFPTTQLLGALFPDPDDLYILWFQKPGEAEALLDQHIGKMIDLIIARFPKGAGGEITGKRMANPFKQVAMLVPPGQSLLSPGGREEYVAALSHNGMFGPVSWYRNIDRNAELFPDLGKRALDIPVLQIEVPEDRFMMPNAGETTKATCRNAEVVTITDCGHWTMLEQPEKLTRSMVDWMHRHFA